MDRAKRMLFLRNIITIAVMLVIILMILGSMSKAYALPSGPYFRYVSVANTSIGYVSGYDGYFLVMSNGSLFQVTDSGLVKELSYGKDFHYIGQTCSAPFNGFDGASIYLAGSREVGVLVGENGKIRLWGFATQFLPIANSTGYDCQNNIIWSVDVKGNLYIARPFQRYIIVIGPDGPENTTLRNSIVDTLSKVALSEALEKLENMGGNFSILNYNFTGNLWVLNAGRTYRVSNNSWYEDSRFLPIYAVGEFMFEIENDSIIKFVPINVTATLFIDSIKENVITLYPDLKGYTITASLASKNYGMLVEIYNNVEKRSSKLVFFRFNNTIEKLFHINESKLILSKDFIPVYDPIENLPALLINFGKHLAYYLARPSTPQWLVWSRDPLRGGTIEEVIPWQTYVVVMGANKLNLLDLELGTPLWAFYEGISFKETSLISLSSGKELAVGLKDGRLLLVSKPTWLSKVNVEITVNGKRIGTGFPLTIKSKSMALNLSTKNGTTTVYLPEGLWLFSANDTILGPISKSFLINSPSEEIMLNYKILSSFYVLLKGKDPLGFLKESPALNAYTVIITPWGTKIRLNVSSNGILYIKKVPSYLSGLFKGLPLREGESYLLESSLKGYLNLSRKITPGNGTITLKPVLTTVYLTLVDKYNEEEIPARLYISYGGHSVELSINGHVILNLPPRNYTLAISASGYLTQVVSLDVNGSSLHVIYKLKRTSTILHITVLDSDFDVPLNATVKIKGPVSLSIFCAGSTKISLPWGIYSVQVNVTGYNVYSDQVALVPEEPSSLIVTMTPKIYYIEVRVLDYYNLTPVNFKALVYVHIQGLGKILYESLSASGLAKIAIRGEKPEIVISSNNYYNYTLIPNSSETFYTIYLKRETYGLTLLVIDKETKKPMAANIKIQGPVSLSTEGPLVRLSLPWGTYKVSVFSRYYELSTSTVRIPATKSLVIELKPIKYTLDLLVRDAYTGSLLNFTIIARPPSPYIPIAAKGYGKITLKLRAGVTYSLLVSSNGYIVKSQDITLFNNELLYVNLQRKKIPISIVVRDEDTGRPIPNANITIYDLTTMSKITGNTDFLGRFITKLVWGKVIVRVWRNNYKTYEATFLLNPTYSNSSTIYVNLEPILHLMELRVIDSETKMPVRDAKITVKNLETGLNITLISSSFSGMLRKGPYIISIEAPGYEKYIETINLTKTEKLAINLEPIKKNIVVSVIDSETKKPIPFSATILSEKGQILYKLNSSGKPVSIWLRTGNYTIIITNPNYVLYKKSFYVSTKNKTLTFSIEMKRVKVPVKFVVVNAKGEPVNAYLEIRSISGVLKIFTNTTVELPIGYSYVIKAWAPKYQPSFRQIVVNEPSTVLLTLTRKPTISGFYIILGIVVIIGIAAGIFISWIRRRSEKELEERLQRLISGGETP